jgi:hypothetical protein
MMMTRYSALLVLLALSINVEAGLFSNNKRSLRERERDRNRDRDAPNPVVEADTAVVPEEETAKHGRSNSRPGRDYRDDTQKKEKVDFSSDGSIDFAPGSELPAMEGGETEELSLAPGPGMAAAIPEDEIDTLPADPNEMPVEELPSMEAEVKAAGERGPPPFDQPDKPNVDGELDEMPKDAPRGAEMAPMEVEKPQMEVNGASQGGADTPDQTDTPTDVDGSEELDEGTPEIAVMELAPMETEVNGAAARGGQDQVDAPNVVDSGSLPDDLDDPEDGFVDMPPMEVTPHVLPFGDQAEGYILGHTVSVCATSQEAARDKCEASAPICKFKRNGNVISSQLQPNQPSNCVRRCEYPLGLDQCQPHEKCFNFIFGCACAPFEFDGGSCQPY